MGVQPNHRAPEPAIQAAMRAELRNLGVRVIHLDEAHHLVCGSPRYRMDVRMLLKDLLSDTEVPVRIVCSGRPEIVRLLDDDSQLEGMVDIISV